MIKALLVQRHSASVLRATTAGVHDLEAGSMATESGLPLARRNLPAAEYGVRASSTTRSCHLNRPSQDSGCACGTTEGLWKVWGCVSMLYESLITTPGHNATLVEGS